MSARFTALQDTAISFASKKIARISGISSSAKATTISHTHGMVGVQVRHSRCRLVTPKLQSTNREIPRFWESDAFSTFAKCCMWTRATVWAMVTSKRYSGCGEIIGIGVNETKNSTFPFVSQRSTVLDVSFRSSCLPRTVSHCIRRRPRDFTKCCRTLWIYSCLDDAVIHIVGV